MILVDMVKVDNGMILVDMIGVICVGQQHNAGETLVLINTSLVGLVLDAILLMIMMLFAMVLVDMMLRWLTSTWFWFMLVHTRLLLHIART